jgi:hypothetical protein
LTTYTGQNDKMLHRPSTLGRNTIKMPEISAAKNTEDNRYRAVHNGRTMMIIWFLVYSFINSLIGYRHRLSKFRMK